MSSEYNDYICNKPVCAVASAIDNPNYFNKVNAGYPPLNKRLTSFATDFGAYNGLNLTLYRAQYNNGFRKYQELPTNSQLVLTNNVSSSQSSLVYGVVGTISGPVINI